MQRPFCKIDYMTGNPLDFDCFSPLFDADKDISTAGGSAPESPPRTPFQEIIFEIAFFIIRGAEPRLRRGAARGGNILCFYKVI